MHAPLVSGQTDNAILPQRMRESAAQWLAARDLPREPGPAGWEVLGAQQLLHRSPWLPNLQVGVTTVAISQRLREDSVR